MNRIKLSSGLSVFFLALLALLVLAAHTGNTNAIPVPAIVSPLNNTNLTGTITLNATIDAIWNTTRLANLTFYFQNRTGYFVHNTTVQNTTFNATIFQNTSFNTLILADGKYNLTVSAVNGTFASNHSFTINQTNISIVIDNTPPNVTINFLNNPGNMSNFSIRSSNQTFNASIFDAATDVASVYFWFDNGTGPDFNVTAVNRSGEWVVSWNVSQLGEGKQGIRIRANDSVGTMNNTALNFTLDLNAPNVSIVSVNANNTFNASNFSYRSNNQTFNVTASDNLTNLGFLYFWFDNGTGVDFNVTGVNQSGEWVVSYNVSALGEGMQGVRVVANDTVDNTNNSVVINFTVDRTAPNITFETLMNLTRNITFTNGSIFINVSLSDIAKQPLNISFFLVNGTNGSHVVIQSRQLSNNSGYWNATIAEVGVLANWNYTINLNVTDHSGNVNMSQIVVMYDNVTPSLTSFTCEDIAQGGRQTCNCIAFDDSQNYTAGIVNITYSEVDTSSAGTASTVCTMKDFAGNQNTTSATFTITASSSSSSSSSSGGGSSSSSSSSSRGATTSGSESGASSGSSGESGGGAGGAGSQASETGTQQGVEGAAGEGTSQEVGSSRNFAGRAFSAIFGEAGSRSVLPLVIVGVLIVALGAGIFFWTRKK